MASTAGSSIPPSAEVFISVVPRDNVLPDKNKSLNLFSLDPKLNVTLDSGSISLTCNVTLGLGPIPPPELPPARFLLLTLALILSLKDCRSIVNSSLRGLRSTDVPSFPLGPCNPCGPTSPRSPFSPLGPISPCGPCMPCIPGSPCSPLSPFTP